MNECYGQRIFIAGHPGQGKTNLLQVLTKDMPRLIVIDPKHSWRINRKVLNLYIAENMWDFLKVFGKCWKKDGVFRIVFEPEPEEEARQGSGIGELLLRLQRPYMENHDMGKTCLVIDELSEVLPNVTLSKNKGVLRCASMGREIGLDVFGGTQYPVDCSKKFRRLCDQALILPVTGAGEVLTDLAAGDMAFVQAVGDLKDHHYVSLDKVHGTFSTKKPAPLIS